MSERGKGSGASNPSSSDLKLVKTEELKPEGYDGTCLRPLGLCDLGGCCDTCWYSSRHKRADSEKD